MNEEKEQRITRELQATPCRYCEHCNVGTVTKLGIEVGWCDLMEQLVQPDELDESQWSMCGEALVNA